MIEYPQPQKNISLRVLLGMGFSFGVLFTFSPGSAFNFLLALLIILALRLVSRPDEKKFLTRLFISGIMVRVFLLLLTQFILIIIDRWTQVQADKALCLFGDDGYYTMRSWWIVKYIFEEPLSPKAFSTLARASEYADSGHLYIMALFHYISGYSPISIIFLNCVFSVLTGTTYYFIAKEITDIKSAKIAAVLITFFPSLILWSVTNLKDPLFIFLTGVILWSFIQLLKGNKMIRYSTLLILALLLQATLRNWISLFALVILGLYYPITKKRIRIFYLVLLIIILVVSWPVLKNKLDELKCSVVNYHWGYVVTGGSTYRLYDDWLYEAGNAGFRQLTYFQLLRGLLKGWWHFFLEPFPSRIISSKLSLVSFPQMIIWYFLLLFCIQGFLIQLRTDWRKNLVFVLYLFIIGSILALTGGNIGTGFRMRDMLTPTIILFSAIGISKNFSKV